MSSCKAPEILSHEAYLAVRRMAKGKEKQQMGVFQQSAQRSDSSCIISAKVVKTKKPFRNGRRPVMIRIYLFFFINSRPASPYTSSLKMVFRIISPISFDNPGPLNYSFQNSVLKASFLCRCRIFFSGTAIT